MGARKWRHVRFNNLPTHTGTQKWLCHYIIKAGHHHIVDADQQIVQIN